MLCLITFIIFYIPVYVSYCIHVEVGVSKLGNKKGISSTTLQISRKKIKKRFCKKKVEKEAHL